MLAINNLSINYGKGNVVENGNLEFGIGVTCITGKSGIGKSSILNALTSQINFHADTYMIGNTDYLKLSADEKTEFIRSHFTYLIQGNNFISDMTCFDNIAFYAKLAGKEIKDSDIEYYLSLVNLKLDKTVYPDRLSGGERQRLAICLALAKDSDVILCDEITASLDGELKQEIFDLLRHIAYEFEKIIIITSHDEDIYEQCDRIYTIENKEVRLIKENLQHDKKTLSSNKIGVLKCGNFKTYVQEKIGRQKWMFLIYIVICSLIVSIFSFLVYFSIDYITEQQRLLKRLSQDQIYVVNQTRSPVSGAYTYFFDNEPFAQNVYEKLEQIEHIDKIYPYYYATLYADDSGPGNVDVNFHYKNGENFTKSLEMTRYEFDVLPLYDEMNFDSKMEIINPENKDTGVFVNDTFLLYYGMTKEDLNDLTIEATIYMPVTYTTTETTEDVMKGEEVLETHEIITYYPEGMPITVNLPVYGYVDYWYAEEWGNPYIYVPYDIFATYHQEVKDNYTLKDGEIPWRPNCYSVFVDQPENMEAVNAKIRQIDDNITTGNRYTSNQEYFKQNQYVKVTSVASLVIVWLAGAILAFVYGIYYYQKNIDDISYFKRNGLSFKETKNMLIYDCFAYGSIVLIFSIPLSIAITYFVASTYFILWYGLFSLRTLGIIVIVLLETILQTIFSRLYFILKIKKIM